MISDHSVIGAPVECAQKRPWNINPSPILANKDKKKRRSSRDSAPETDDDAPKRKKKNGHSGSIFGEEMKYSGELRRDEDCFPLKSSLAKTTSISHF